MRINQCIIGLLFLVSAVNATRYFHQYYHLTFFRGNDTQRVDQALAPVREFMEKRGIRTVEYVPEAGLDPGRAASQYFAVQYSLAPVVVQRYPVNDQLLFADYWISKQPFEIPEAILVEDFGNGFALYRRK